MGRMSSRERLLAAIHHTEPDRVPFLFNVVDPVLPPGLQFRNQLERADRLLGLDDTLRIHVPWRLHPDVRTRTWREQSEGERYPLLFKVYETPGGELWQVVMQTDDWPHGDDVAVFDDFNVPRSRRFLVETEADLELLPYILGAPSEDQVRRFRSEARDLRREADNRGVAIEGHCTTGADSAIWLCGVENFLLACKERPAFAREVLRIVHEWEMSRLRLLLETEVCDIIVRRAWYESPSFFSPAAYREMLFPLIREEVKPVHQTGAKYQYIMTTGIMDLIPEFLELGIDMLWGVDPVQGGADLARLKRECGSRICLVGGVNSYITLGRGSDEAIRTAVRQAIETLGPGGGFILLPVDAIDHSTPWENVERAIAAWKEYGSYPISKGRYSLAGRL